MSGIFQKHTVGLINQFKQYRESLNGEGKSSFFQMAEKAQEQLTEASSPTRKDEEWKYTSFDAVLQDDWKLALDKPSGEEVALPEILGLDAFSISLFNGHLVSIPTIEGVEVEQRNLSENSLHNPENLPSKYFELFNASLAPSMVEITVKRNAVVEKPIRISNTVGQSGQIGAYRIKIVAESGSQVHFIEENSFEGNGLGYINRTVEVDVAQDAMVEHTMIQNYGAGQSSWNGTKASVQKNGNYKNNVVTFGGKVVRNDLDIRLEDEHCDCHLNGLYLLDGKTHVDNHTSVDHLKPNCESHEFYKGVMKGHSTGVFNGKVFVREDAQKTNAYQQNRNLLLSDNATINTKPQLEIWADDVKCSHGATIGQLDDKQLFYLKARGIGEELAKALMVYAFASEVVEKIGNEALRQHLFGFIKRQLNFELD